MSDPIVIVGVRARVSDPDRAVVKEHLVALPRVETFEVAAAPRMGFVIEAPDLDAAHTCLRGEIDTIPGVLGTWPVSVELDDGSGDGSGEPARAPAAASTSVAAVKSTLDQ